MAGMEINGNKLISIGYENLMAARNLFVVVLGSDKRQYIAELFENEDSDNKTILSILIIIKIYLFLLIKKLVINQKKK